MSILSKDSIKELILPHLSVSKKGMQLSENKIIRIVQVILYRLKTGCQWRELPMREFFDEPYTQKSVFHHFNKWSKEGCWQEAWQHIVAENKELLDMSSVQLDGTHTRARGGGGAVAYQGRKSANTSNMLCISDANGILLMASKPISGNRHDSTDFEENMKHIASMAQEMGISLDGLFLNADAGFDNAEVRRVLDIHQIQANIAQNPRSGNAYLERDDYFDELLYQARFVIERSFAWIDGQKALMTRYEKTARNWFSMNMLGFLTILERKIT
jgi:transposase